MIPPANATRMSVIHLLPARAFVIVIPPFYMMYSRNFSAAGFRGT